MSNKPLTSLEDFHPFEVSLVSAGANKKKRFPVFKKEQVMQFDEILKGVLETELDEEAELMEKIEKAQVSEKGKNAIKAALRILSGFKDEMPKDVMDSLAAAVGYPAPKAKACTPDEEEMKEKKTVAKSEVINELPEIVQKRFETLEAENKALKDSNEAITKALKDQKEAAELAAWEAKAEKELSHYPGKSTEEIAKSLHALAKADPKLAEEHFATMKAASDALKESNLLKSAGGRGESNGDSAYDKIEKMADELIAKSSDLDMTREKAVKAVLDRRPDLYTAYLQECPDQS